MQSMLTLIKAVLLILSFQGYFFAVYRFGKIKKWFVPVIAMTGIGLVLFWAGLAGMLAPAADLIYLGGIACACVFFVFAFQKKIRPPRMGLCEWFFAAGAGAFALLSLNMKLTHYDNFSHWALIVKYLLSAGHLPEADTVLVPFRDYPPGAGLFIYYVCRYAGHSQGVMLLAQNSLIFACFYAVFGIVKERRRFLLYSFLGMGCSVLSYLNLTVRINNLLVDFLLPLLTMASVAISRRGGEEPGKLCLLQSLILGFTGIVKGTGIFFSGAAILYAFRKTRSVFRSALMAAGSFLPFLAWQYHLRFGLAGFEGKFGVRTAENAGNAAAVYGAPVDESLYGQVAEAFFRELTDLSERAAQMFVLATAAVVCALIYARIKKKRREALRRALPAALALTALYYAGMLYMYLFSMPAQEAVRLAGFERYACSITVLYAGILLMGAEADMEESFAVGIDVRGAYKAYSSPAAKRRYQYTVLGTLAVGLNFLYSEFSGLSGIRADYRNSIPGQAQTAVGDNWYKDGQEDERKYLIVAPGRSGEAASGEIMYVFRYFLWAPDVDVTDSLSPAEAETAKQRYDRIILLHPSGRS